MSSIANKNRPLAAADASEREYLDLLVRSDYERCHPNDTWEDLKRRSRFSKEDKGLLRDWIALAAQRATAKGSNKPDIGFNRAA
ncbi:MAG: hypothetical protein IRY89_14255 [Pseudolabrys sp.]|nr:hypothetical protein [Pseudolabrys sp.]